MTQPDERYRPEPPPRPAADAELRRDLEAAVAARRDLGPEYEEHIAAGLAQRVEELVAYRTAELRADRSAAGRDQELERRAQTQGFVLGIISLGMGVPVTAIAATQVDQGLLGVAVGWAGIVGVNLAQAWRSRQDRDR